MNVRYDKKDKYKLIDEVGFRKYFQAESWPEFNRQFFDGLAPKYDKLNEVLSLGQHHRIKQQAIRKMGIKNGDRVLDLCTGSGDVAIWIARQYPQCEVVGGDVSLKMLEIATQRGAGLKNLTFQTADGMRLPFSDQSFDHVIVSFGLRNLDDLKTGLLEMKRVTRCGGQVMNLDLGRPQGDFLRAVHEVYFRKIIPFIGKHIFHRGEFNSFAYLPNSGKYFPNQRELVAIFSELGFCDVQNFDYMLGSIAQQLARV